jgi:hypothetical protein
VTTPVQLATVLHAVVARRADPSGRAWLDRALAAAASGEGGGVLADFTAAARRLGKAPLRIDRQEQVALDEAGVTWPIEEWGLDEAGRVVLLLTLAGGRRGPELESLVETCYRQGDLRERQAVVRTLGLLPAAERFLALGVDACRTHIQPLFEAIACENPYPARHFPELAFNQMVLKALHTGVALDRVLGLRDRVTPELGRMAAGYASERRAAGRSVPPDIARLSAENGVAG